MARILVNYVYNKSKDKYEIMSDSKYVFYDMDVAVLNTADEIVEPLVVPIDGNMTVVDKRTYEMTHKLFRLLATNEGKVFEAENGTEIWLPRDTDLSKLRVVNGQLVLVENEESEPKKEVKQSKPRKNNKAN